MANTELAPEQIRQYQQDGYLIVKNLIQADEVAKLHQVAIERMPLGLCRDIIPR